MNRVVGSRWLPKRCESWPRNSQGAPVDRELIGEIQTETQAAVHVVQDGAQKTADGATVVEHTRERS